MSAVDNNVRIRGLDSGAVDDSDDKDDLNANMKASVDKTTGKNDGQIAYEARVHQMDDERVSHVADDQRRRGVTAQGRIPAPDHATPAARHDVPTVSLSDLDPYRRA